MKPEKEKKQLSQIEKMIIGKEKLVIKLQGDIEDVKANSVAKIKEIEFRIQIAQTLLGALKKGRA